MRKNQLFLSLRQIIIKEGTGEYRIEKCSSGSEPGSTI